MKKLFFLLSITFLLNGCFQSVALIGSSVGGASSGKMLQSSLNSAVSYGIKKKTGKTPLEHAADYVEKNNPDDEKKPCVSFLENTTSETCAVIKRRLAELRKSIEVKSKIKSLD